MADNLSINTGSGATLATDVISDVHYQRAKLVFGADGATDGDVDDLLPLPVSAAGRTDVIQNGNTQVTPAFAKIALTATGTVVAATSGKKIRVLAFGGTFECLTGDETYTFNSGASGTALTGALCDSAGAGAVVPINSGYSPVGHFETATSALLELALAGTSPNAQGWLVYALI